MERMFRDQYGNTFRASSVANLRSQIEGGGSRVGRMFQDKPDGSTMQVGYVIGRHWLTEWAPVEKPIRR